MKKSKTYKVALGCLLMFLCCTISAQRPKTVNVSNPNIGEADKRIDDYRKLLKLGYSEKEIFEDLGNVNFLTENYGTAAFWYQKLMDISEDDAVSASYHKRYQYAMKMSRNPAEGTLNEQDWLAEIRADYQLKKNPQQGEQAQPLAGKYREINFQVDNSSQALRELVQYEIGEGNDLGADAGEKLGYRNAYQPPVALTADGKTAYFSKAIYVKPLYGLFSKKQLVHKIFKADRINGQWKNIQEVAVCPKHASAMHPAISEDGKRLFFASDMPGTFGKYDIYVSAIHNDGTVGIAKNLGEKVNTEKNDLYPNIVGGNSLFFASDGRKGNGGLDIYLAEVGHKKVGRSFNLGSPINSDQDDFSIVLMTERGTGYVMSNRNRDKDVVQQLAFSYSETRKSTPMEQKEYNLLETLNNDLKIDYSTTIFEDQE
ncbi:cell envelope biogenesis protein OmpA [Flavobacteriaceae bacterium 3-367]|uniref:cell envelope biogenesis protein OmpA n=1 Tax=Eudoraea algarum TaxID=3417568 RepID=UPI00327CAEA2